MILMLTLIFITTVSFICGIDLPDPKFVTDLANTFNRFGIIYHIPSVEPGYVHDYKSIEKYK